ncbi:hypothetical protein WOLCODRAFT_145608 [Wolfiporia cocos MD-104 SS10]|uniref:PARP catalytic domain-containing protein n=1 Tax=Wolfiporia cocos (strain MD-104) TaxID=742152 RepID=A0A2H3IZ60_WOLCO|nr:hypothetical protein WOLCODRAFT_145608 [Wolfiporia cocos MD-104 SS10]
MTADLFITSSNIHSSSFYRTVENMFLQAWQDTRKNRPHVHAVWYINAGSQLLGRPRFSDYLNYKAQIQRQLGRNKVEEELYRGVRRACNIGDDGHHLNLCNLAECDLCRILECRYRLRNSNGTANFGTGIYTSAHSSKADDYAINAHNQSRFHVVLLSHVVTGNTYSYQSPHPQITGPPNGYQSVGAIPKRQGGTLIHPETIVYRTDAAIPSVMVVYTR